MSRQTTLGRFGFKKAFRTEIAWLIVIIVIIVIIYIVIIVLYLKIFQQTKLYLSFSKSQPRLYS